MSKRNNIAVDGELHRQFKVRTAELGLKLNEATDEALRDWIRAHPKPKRNGQPAVLANTH